MVSVNMRVVAVEEHFTFPDLLGRMAPSSQYTVRTAQARAGLMPSVAEIRASSASSEMPWASDARVTKPRRPCR